MKNQLLIYGICCSLISSSACAALFNTPDRLAPTLVKYAKSNSTKNISAQQAAHKVQKKFGGKVLKVKSSGSSKKPSYRVKLLKSSGHIVYFNVDAKSGRIKR